MSNSIAKPIVLTGNKLICSIVETRLFQLEPLIQLGSGFIIR